MAVHKALYVAVLTLSVNLFAADPFVGRWRLDLARTTTTPPNPTAPRPRDVTLVAKDQGENRVVTVRGTNADGSPIRGGFTIPINGGPGKVEPSENPSFDGVTMKYVNTTVHDLIYTMGDRSVATRHVVISPDQKTMTTTYKGADYQGNPITRVEVWHRQ